MGDSISIENLIYIINHIFLPPKLPDHDDSSVAADLDLLYLTSKALRGFKNLGGEANDIVSHVCGIISNLIDIHEDTGYVSEERLLVALPSVSEDGSTIPLYIKQQNAGLLISRRNDEVHFAAFEISPRNAAVLETRGRLLRAFPDRAVTVQKAIFDQPNFQATFAVTVARMSHQTVPGMQAIAKKASEDQHEIRETTSPYIVTQMLMSFLEAIGKPCLEPKFEKHTRDEVLWHNAFKPWRRSPLWLIIRVALYTGFCHPNPHTKQSRSMYKNFMVYLMSYVLDEAVDQTVPSDLLHVMNAKIAQRLLKLGSEGASLCIEKAGAAMQKAHEVLGNSWKSYLNTPTRPIPSWEECDIEDSIPYTLPDLECYLEFLEKKDIRPKMPEFFPENSFKDYQYFPDSIPSSADVAREYQDHQLYALEKWVEDCLPSWLQGCMTDIKTCESLHVFAKMYHQLATDRYSNAERYSVVILTITELWIACDKSALAHHPMLSEYNPLVPADLLQSLVLPFKKQMQRLTQAERYIKQRSIRSNRNLPNPLIGYGDTTSFAARHFTSSAAHQHIRTSIENKARDERRAKIQELATKKQEHHRLMELHRQSTCDNVPTTGGTARTRQNAHKASCKKCQYQSQADSIQIQVHEWPLPNDEVELKCTVFELSVPEAFGQWRDMTLFFLYDTLGMDHGTLKKPQKTYPLKSYQGLYRFYGSGPSRIGLHSETKSQLVTHRQHKIIANILDAEVCLNNGLQYQYFDDQEGYFIRQYSRTDKLQDSCAYGLARESPLRQFMIKHPSAPEGMPPNTVIAQQHECPEHFSLEEFRALASLPLGFRVQWTNILVQLHSPVIDFQKHETWIVLLQTVSQAGPASNERVERDSHEILLNSDFCRALLDGLNTSLYRIEENWNATTAFVTFVDIARRLLSITASVENRIQCLEFLSEARRISLKWLSLIMENVNGSTCSEERMKMLAEAVVTALACVNTINIDQEHLDIVLPGAVASTLVQCSIFIQENLVSEHSSLLFHSILLRRWESLLYRALPLLKFEFLQSPSCSLLETFQVIWSNFEAGSCWRELPAAYGNWLKASMPSGAAVVHFNLLTAEFLVKGVPLSRLPKDYEEHTTYAILFGHSTLEVMPSTDPGMTFSSKRSYAGYNLHLGIGTSMDSVSDLMIHAIQNNRSYDLIPARIFRGKFPHSFVEQYIHWYDRRTGSIEFRPRQTPWEPAPANWNLTRGDESWLLSKEGERLLSIGGPLTTMLSEALSDIEDPLHIHTALQISGIINIELPRIQLGFFVDPRDRSINSRQFRAMCVDENQTIGTLCGLKNRLVLRHNQGNHDRIVLVSDGEISHGRNGDCTFVAIDKNTATKTYAYHVDSLIGRLIDSGNLQSKLWLCYLHGLTSFCLRDPLTHRTGTEQALWILNSGAVRSFDRLNDENVAILQKIALLSPQRGYYPMGKKVMQEIEWDKGLSFMSHHFGFYQAVQSILSQHETGQMYYPDTRAKLPELAPNDVHLSERDCIRSSTFWIEGFGAQQYVTAEDQKYKPNEEEIRRVNDRSHLAQATASAIFRGSEVRLCSRSSGYLWNAFAVCDIVSNKLRDLRSSDLDYDAKWLNETSEVLKSIWSPARRYFLNRSSSINKFRVMMWLTAMAFTDNANMGAVQMLVAFYTSSRSRLPRPPGDTQFVPSKGKQLSQYTLESLISCHRREFVPSRYHTFDQNNRSEREFSNRQNELTAKLADGLADQWPAPMPAFSEAERRIASDIDIHKYIDWYPARTAIVQAFDECFANLQFSKYLGLVELQLENLPLISDVSASSVAPIYHLDTPQVQRCITATDMFAKGAPLKPLQPAERPRINVRHISDTIAGDDQSLTNLLDGLALQARSAPERNYVHELRKSLASLERKTESLGISLNGIELKEDLDRYFTDCVKYSQQLCSRMIEALVKPVRTPFDLAIAVEHSPRISSLFFLEQLNVRRWFSLSDDWKQSIAAYGLSLTEVQRARRLSNQAYSPQDLVKELCNTGHENWNVLEDPESLLLEVESGILIRSVQEDISQQMMKPSEDCNAMMQLNMGEGKSSVIAPRVAAKLADGKCLVRVFVGKPQSKQMLQMLVSKLGGLLNKQIYQIPFSRSIKPKDEHLKKILQLCKECRKNRGILMVQPENVLSLQLKSLDCLLDGHEGQGECLLKLQAFFNRNARDIVDESDENFSVKFELIYTMGMQKSVELSPDRWTIIQSIMEIFAKVVVNYPEPLDNLVEVDIKSPGRYPRLRILDAKVKETLLGLVAAKICDVGFPGLPISRQPQSVREAIYIYLTQKIMAPEEIDRVEKCGFWSKTTKQPLLLIRGLLAYEVLYFAFSSKRWRVNYGVDSMRVPKTRLAVPFVAKDCPSLRSEFSHPDVVICLTCLTYYYQGLDDSDMFLTLSHLLKSDQAQAEYDEWVRTSHALPTAFRNLVGINIQDQTQCITQLFPCLRYSKGTIDYFLSRLVFPKEMKEFPHKISASGWDLGALKKKLTTGFSGTNDSRQLLPLDVRQLDLPDQKHTNALVLSYLLQDENTVSIMPAGAGNTISDAERLLGVVVGMNPAVRVLLDVGAQILELNNIQVARKWLSMVEDDDQTKAVVFFDENDNLLVIDRKERIEPLQTSAYASSLNLCLVYLDEVHTRGTDLKLPQIYRAAVTLGAGLTKDRLVQACMRMRALGKGQSVVFCVPHDVQNKVRECCAIQNSSITVANILAWSISETWADLKKGMPLWAVQGRRFQHQRGLWGKLFEAQTEEQAREFLEKEALTLEDRYLPGRQIESDVLPDGEESDLGRIEARCREYEISPEDDSADLYEQQERELAPEIQHERQTERPDPAEPETHSIHEDLEKFVKTGRLSTASRAIMSAFNSLNYTSSAALLDVSEFSRELLVTRDFMNTVKTRGSDHLDSYQRPVQWLLSSIQQKEVLLIVISPYEAHNLLPLIREYRKVTLHCYAPRISLDYCPLDGLNLHTEGKPFDPRHNHIPQPMVQQLNLFAGQLYFSCFKEYKLLCDSLNLASGVAKTGQVLAADGFILEPRKKHSFNDSPVPFLRDFISKVRRDRQGIDRTHLGMMLMGSLLERNLIEGHAKDTKDCKRKRDMEDDGREDDLVDRQFINGVEVITID